MKLRTKINREIAKAFIIVLIACVCIFLPWQKQKSKLIHQKLITLMQTFIIKDSTPLANAVFENRQRAIDLRAQAFLKIEGIKSVFIYGRSGQLLSREDTVSPLNRGSREFELAGRQELHTWTEKNSLWYLQAINAVNETIGFLLIEYSLADMKRKETFSFLLFIGTILVLMVLLLLLTNRLIRNIILQPVDRLIHNMAQIEQGRYGAQITPVTGDEIGELAKRFNAMSSEIDISYKRIEQQNEQLLTTKNLLDGIINSMPSILITIDDDCRIKEWNTRAKAVSGILGSNARERLLSQVFEFTVPLMPEIKTALAGNTSKKFSKVEAVMDSRPCFFDLTVYPIVAEAVDDAVIIIEDITDLVHMENMVVQSEKMVSIGGLAAGMAHEINNPLAGMIQNAQVIASRMSADLPGNVSAARELGLTMDLIRGYMEKREIFVLLRAVQTSGGRAARIVRNMLDFSRQSKSRASDCDIGGIMDACVRLSENDYDLSKQFDFKGIEIIREYDPVPFVVCDENRIQQVFFNILKNGAEAMADESEPGKKYYFILRIKTLPDCIQVEIEDNGPGMAEAVKKRVFEPFFTTKEVGIGTGLGLSVAYFIVTENHNGKMWVESSPGAGARFVIQLPGSRRLP